METEIQKIIEEWAKKRLIKLSKQDITELVRKLCAKLMVGEEVDEDLIDT